MTTPTGPSRRYPFQRSSASAAQHTGSGASAQHPSTAGQPGAPTQPQPIPPVPPVAPGPQPWGGYPSQHRGFPQQQQPWPGGRVQQPPAFGQPGHPGFSTQVPSAYGQPGYPTQGQPIPPYPQQWGPHPGPGYGYPQQQFTPQWGPQPGWGPVYPQQWAPVAVDPRPTFPAVYQQILRGPKHRWWRPLVSFALLAAGVVGGMVALMVGVFTIYLVKYGDDAERQMNKLFDLNNMGAAGFLMTNLSLILLIPAVLLAFRVGHGMPIRYLWSVVGRWRWGWFGRCLLVLTPLWVLYVGLGYFAAPGTKPRSDEWIILLILVATTTPFQCLAEEVVFRGWFLTSIGSWLRNHVLGWIVPAVLSTAAFAAAHGSFDPWVLADLSVFAFTASFLCWWTGGLEAATAIHIVNNVLLMAFTVLIGEFGAGMIDAETTGDWQQVAVSLVVHAIALALILWQAKRAGITRHFQPVQARAPQPAAA